MRKLTLKKETLVELSAQDLSHVVGGYDGPTTPQCISGIVSCATYRCPTLNDCVATIGGC